MRTLTWTLTTLLLLQPLLTHASLFPDVPDDHPYKEEIERLAGVQVIGGNPNGTFTPDVPVNRAAMLKMLYKASGRTPDPANLDCFVDVEKGSWYEAYVCDAEANRFVQGYSDGSFKPNNSVNRAEAIKMTMLVLNITVPELTTINRDVLKYVDISTSAWYTKYLSAAFTKGILPIRGQTGARFYPDWPLLRGEAAAYISNALDVQFLTEKEETEEELSGSSSSAGEGTSSADTTTGAASSAKSSRAPDRQIPAAFPLDETGTFEDKASVAYVFTLGKQQMIDATVSIKAGEAGKVSCRLYKLEPDGLSNEYYLGYQEGQSCYILAYVLAGNYQLQIEPTTPNVSYTAVMKEGTGDGNDGFSQARSLTRGNLQTEILSGGDYEDWFKFTVTRETEMTLKIVSASKLRCLIYPGKDVDVFGFSGPQCGESYLYPVGTYIVGIGHASPKAAKQTYTIQLK